MKKAAKWLVWSLINSLEKRSREMKSEEKEGRKNLEIKQMKVQFKTKATYCQTILYNHNYMKKLRL